jgi:RNA polymerase sigma factor (sigma-70 family)
MSTAPITRAIKDLRRLVEARNADDLTDRQLLERFARQHDEAAFAQVVRRHGPMVLGVCRRLLGRQHDAEDVFQAAFLVLARKAATVRWQDSAGGWLFQVAHHLALKMKADTKRRRTEALPDMAGPDPGTDRHDTELHSILDEELGRLPEKYRLALLLCCYEGKTRAEAARQLGWKEGAVKIRLERGRALLRSRLTRRGLALTGAAVASMLAESAAKAMPAKLLHATVAAAKMFAIGKIPAAAAAQSAAALAEGALKTMMMIRLKLVLLITLAVTVASVGVGFCAHRAFADKPREAARTPQELVREPLAKPLEEPEKALAPAIDPDKPLRVLLFAGAPTREYQFVRNLCVKEVDKNMERLNVYLQSGGRPGIVQDVPADRLLKQFPTRLEKDEKDDAEDKYGNLAQYDLIIAFDPDWSKLTEEQGQLLEKWVGEEGHGLIIVVGLVNTLDLCRPGAARKLKPILDLLPVRLEDPRIMLIERAADKPWPLAFPHIEKFLNLDEDEKYPPAGWSEFFFDKQRDNWMKTEDQPVRGFYSAHTVKSVKADAVVLARFRDPSLRIQEGDQLVDLPFLVTMKYGKGRTIYLGSGETWRLRQYRESFHERFWNQLARYAASAGPREVGKPGDRAPTITPKQRKAIDKGLQWLKDNQLRDGHWKLEPGHDSTTETSLVGMALLMQGSTIDEGEHFDRIRRAVDWVISHCQKDGLIGIPTDATEAEKYLEGHGQAMLFLASVYGEEEDRERRTRLERLLTRAVEFTVKAQTPGGGWGYLSRGLAKEDDNEAAVVPTVLQLQALVAARGVGIAVPKSAISAAQEYLIKNVDPATLALVPGLLGAFSPLKDTKSETAKKWLPAAQKLAPDFDAKGRPSSDDVYYFAQLAYTLGDQGNARLLPDSKPAARITWTEFRTKAFDHLIKTQNSDGSWGGGTGDVYATALYLAILQLDYAVLPIYQR